MSSCEKISYLCRQYGKQLSKNGYLAEHKQIIHQRVKRAVNKENKYPCGICGQQFSQKGSLAKHKRAIHEEVKYTCGQCNY